MKNLTFLILLFGWQSIAQVLTDRDKEAIKTAVQQGLQEEAQRIEAAKTAAATSKPVNAVKFKLDTITDYEVYQQINNRFINNVEVKHGVYYFNFIGDVPAAGLTDNTTVTNFPNAATSTTTPVSRTIAGGNNRRLVYAELANVDEPEVIFEQELGVGIMTVPFKIRGRVDDRPSESKADIKNLCLTGGYFFTREKYYHTGKKVRFRWGFVGLAGGSVETLKAINTRGLISDEEATNQFYLTASAGILVTAYDKINIAFLPFGWDIGLSETSDKWIYNKRYWFGFGLGIDTSLFYFSSKRKNE